MGETNFNRLANSECDNATKANAGTTVKTSSALERHTRQSRLREHNARKQHAELRRLLQIDACAPKLRAADCDTGDVAVGEIDAGKRGLKQLRSNEQAAFKSYLRQLTAAERTAGEIAGGETRVT